MLQFDRTFAATLFTALGLAGVPSAMAGDVPPFLANGQKYATQAANCTGAEGSETGLSLSSEGLFGIEFGCILVDYLPVRDRGVTEPVAYIAIASCGDDSGISRPDLFNLSMSEGSVYVTSQNAYAAASAQPFDGKTDPFETGIIEKRLDPCK